MGDHELHLNRCTELGGLAAANGESAVGCVVVKDGRVIGEASEQSRQLKDITRHAETIAILNAVRDYGNCEGAVLYTNVEPCVLCSYVIRHHKINQVIYTKPCGELGGTGPLFPILTADVSSWAKAPEVVHYQQDL